MKYLKDKYALFLASAIALCMTLFPVAANAVPPDFTQLTTAFDISTVLTAIMSIAAILAGLYVAIKGAKTVIAMIRGG